jgi:CubicO group peptidase (beta-lactamase class C family)
MKTSLPISINFLFILLIIHLSACNGNATSLVEGDTASAGDQDKINKINALLNDYNAYGKFNGSVLIAEEGEVVYKKGFGMANMEWDIPNQPDTKFRIASITKQFTAMLILQLASENKLDLHATISTYLPNYPKKNGDRITIHHLLSHTSGTPEFDVLINYRDIEKKRLRPEEMIEIFAEGELQFTPGEKYSYTNTGYVVLGYIIETITGKSYAEVLQEKIFTPLKMTNSGYDQHYKVLKNRASGYSKGYLRNDYYNVNFVDMSIPYAAGSIYSTVEDLYLWDQALYTEKLLPQKYRDLLFAKHISTRNRYYGYGWFIKESPIGSTSEYIETFSHGGDINGFRTLITRIPSTQSTIILLCNVEGRAIPRDEITRAIIGILYNQPYDHKLSVAYSLQEVIKKEGVQAGIDYYNEVRNVEDYYLDEDEMNIAGYEFLLADQAKNAEVFFKLNVEAFPKSANVYDSYGEVLLMLGDKEKAIDNYKKSVELNPNNRNGVQVLEALENE